MRDPGEDAYFAASNSCNGFQSYYQECFDRADIDRVWAIKGGPGTGKSRFLREVARAGESAGAVCEYIYCSSDPNSLDGVIIRERERTLALMDATAPHVYEPAHPGVREEIINLGTFWNADALCQRRSAIERLSGEKSDAYRRAYRYLSGAGEMVRIQESLVKPCFYPSKIKRCAAKLLAEVTEGEEYDPRPALMGSIGMKGRIVLNSYCKQAKRLILLEDCYGGASRLLEAILEICREKRLAVRISRDPICPWILDGVFLLKEGIALVTSTGEKERGAKRLSARRFLDPMALRRVREELVYAKRCYRAMVDGAIEALHNAESAHFALEEIYMDCMDFSQKEAFTASFCHSLFPCNLPEDVIQ